MKMTIWVKLCLSKSRMYPLGISQNLLEGWGNNLLTPYYFPILKMISIMKKLLFIFTFFCSFSVWAKVETSHLFIHLSDAMAEVKKDNHKQALPFLNALENEFNAIPSHNSKAGQAVSSALNFAKSTPNNDTFEQLSKALLAFEKEQNPVDYTAKREQFAKRITPVYKKLATAIRNQQLDETQTAYNRFNNTWTLNEKVVRETSIGHYGKIETAMTLLRAAMLSEPANFTEMINQANLLGTTLEDFKSGNVFQPQTTPNGSAPYTLPEGIELLEQAYASLENNQTDKARADITLFIQQWAIFEGEVRTRHSALYTRVESDLPLIMAKGNDPANLQKFTTLIHDLKALNLNSSYGIFDAMLILLREGVEALLIIMALITTLKVAKQPKAKRWVYAGANLGLFASIIGAIALQRLFPAISAGTNREILEGIVGIVAVVMMLFVGAWLHSKSSMLGWKQFVDRHANKALATGSLFSMMSLSFLSVFREGAETILFYAGIMPQISSQDLLLGIGFALFLLAIISFIMQRSSSQLPIPKLFKVMTWLIYALGFKILGVSINALQLTQSLPRHLVETLPNLPFIGFYSSIEGISAQLIYLVMIPIFAKLFRN